MKIKYNTEDKKITGLIDEDFLEIIKILQEKGYYVEYYHKANLDRVFIISNLIHDLERTKVLEIQENNIDKIKDAIKCSDYETTSLTFKEAYDFPLLPDDFVMINNCLMANLSILKDSTNFEFRSLVELDKELKRCIEVLKKWAQDIPSKKD